MSHKKNVNVNVLGSYRLQVIEVGLVVYYTVNGSRGTGIGHKGRPKVTIEEILEEITYKR